MSEKRNIVAQPTPKPDIYIENNPTNTVDYYQEFHKNIAVASVSVPNASTIAATTATTNSATTPSSTASAQGIFIGNLK